MGHYAGLLSTDYMIAIYYFYQNNLMF